MPSTTWMGAEFGVHAERLVASLIKVVFVQVASARYPLGTEVAVLLHQIL